MKWFSWFRKKPEHKHEWKCACGSWNPDLDHIQTCQRCKEPRPAIGVYRRT